MGWIAKIAAWLSLAAVAWFFAVETGAQQTEAGGASRPSSVIYSWPGKHSPADALANRIKPPAGFARETAATGSFAEWLRHLPLKKGSPPVVFFNGQEKPPPRAHDAVVDIDAGGSDLQQCADAVMRLRAEYLFSVGKFDEIHFNFTSGHRADWSKWADGYRAAVSGNVVKWVKTAGKDASYHNFRNGYMNKVFQYAGTASLSKELQKVERVSDMRIGDVFIQPGSPGHAVIVVDMAGHPRNGKKVFLLAQSYMPAQSVHIIKNPNDRSLSPWYPLDFGEKLITYEWTFARSDLKRFN